MNVKFKQMFGWNSIYSCFKIPPRAFRKRTKGPIDDVTAMANLLPHLNNASGQSQHVKAKNWHYCAILWRYKSNLSYPSVPERGEWSVSWHGHFTPREWALGTYWIGGWMGPQPVWMWQWREKSPSQMKPQFSSFPVHTLHWPKYPVQEATSMQAGVCHTTRTSWVKCRNAPFWTLS
jgi:hypothetical protein